MVRLLVRVPLLVGLLIGTPISAQVAWTQVATTVAPAPRSGHAVAYDTARGRVVLFGGYNSSLSQTYADTWEWDGSSWTQQTPATSPPARSSHAMAYDSARGRTVLFGGETQGGIDMDTWEWDGTNWTRRTPATSPPGRVWHAMAYDSARGRTVLFGGFDGGLPLSDTWEWDGTSWTQRLPSSWPPARDGHSLAYDAVRGRTVVFSSRQSSSWLYDTWEWDGANWSQRTPTTSPPARTRYGLAYDSARRRTVLWGGSQGSVGLLSDTWEWDGTNWTQRTPATSPPGRLMGALVYDSARGRSVLFGGYDNVPLADTWVYQPVNPAAYTTLGTGCTGTAGTPALAPMPGHLPWLGDSFTLQVRNLPTTAPVVYLFGNSNTAWGSFALPADLTPIGMNGCILRAAGIVTLPMLNQAGTASITFAIPTVRYLVRAPFYDQAFALDQQANPFGATLSNAGEMRFGER